MKIYFNACDFLLRMLFSLVTIVVFKWSNNISWLLLAKLFSLSLYTLYLSLLFGITSSSRTNFSGSTKTSDACTCIQCLCNVHSYDCYSKLKLSTEQSHSQKSSSKTFTQNVLNGKTTKMQNLCNLRRTWKSFCLVVFVGRDSLLSLSLSFRKIPTWIVIIKTGAEQQQQQQ